MHFFFLVLAVLATAAVPTVTTNSAKEPSTFRVRLVEDLGTLDWNYGEINPEISYQLMEGLFRTNAKGQAVPAAARSFRWNKEKTELVVQLDPESRWSDGSPLCAQQFVDSWQRLKDKTFASPYAHYAHTLKSFEAKSCRELRVKFERPSPEATALFAHYVFFPIRLDQLKKSPQIFKEGVGLLVNGPYQVQEWKTNQNLMLLRNPRYGRKKPVVERLEFYFIPDENTAQVMFEQKRIDWLKDVPQLLRTKTMEKSAAFQSFPNLTTFYFGLNVGKSELLQDEEIRFALSESLDRKEISKILGKEYKGTKDWLSPVIFPALTPAATANKKKLESARKKLEAAKAAGKMDLLLRVYSKAAHRSLAEWAQGQWEKKLGVRIPIEVIEAKVYWREIYTDPPPIFLSGVTAPYSHPRAFLQEFLSTSTANWTGWSSPEYDKAVNEDLFQEAEDILQKSGVIVPLYTRDTVALINPRWKGFYINPLGQIFLGDLR